jgi:hypothetical protein
MRAASAGLPAPLFLPLSSASARWIDSAALTAHSGIHVCGDGPKQQRESGDPGQTDEKGKGESRLHSSAVN